MQSNESRNEKLFHQKTKRADFPEENSCRPRNLSQKTRKGQLPKKSALKSKKLELNSTILELKSRNKCSDRTKKPDPSIGSGLKVKNKTIRVLLDSGSSEDLLFMKKGSSKRISVVKRVVPQSWGTSNGTFVTDRGWVTLISFLWSTRPAERSTFSQIS